MKQPNQIVRTLIAAAVTSVVIAGCATTATVPEGATDARNKLTQLQSDSQLATRAPVAIKDAELAVRAAEKPQEDMEVGDHLVYMADRKVDIARALAQSRLLVSQRDILSKQRAKAQLDARNRELASSRNETDAARMDTIAARKQAADLQRQIVELNAKPTERGLVVTLGDVLFDTNKSDLKSGAATNLAKLAAFLKKYPDRSVLIEGHTDDTGTYEYNLGLSQRRADAVKSWLVSQGVNTARIVTSGMGEGLPVAGNDSAAGRQLNRRVEVIIENTVAADDLMTTK